MITDQSSSNRERIRDDAKRMLAMIVREPADEFECVLVNELIRQSENPSPTWVSNMSGKVEFGW